MDFSYEEVAGGWLVEGQRKQGGQKSQQQQQQQQQLWQHQQQQQNFQHNTLMGARQHNKRGSAFRFEYEKTDYHEPETHLCSKPAWCFSIVGIIAFVGILAYVNNFWVDYPTADTLRIVDIPGFSFEPKSLADLLLDPSKASITLSLLLSLNVTNPNSWISVDVTQAKVGLGEGREERGAKRPDLGTSN